MKGKKLNLDEKQEECIKCETSSLEITAGGSHVKCKPFPVAGQSWREMRSYGM